MSLACIYRYSYSYLSSPEYVKSSVFAKGYLSSHQSATPPIKLTSAVVSESPFLSFPVSHPLLLVLIAAFITSQTNCTGWEILSFPHDSQQRRDPRPLA